ncbi:hypothetical protein [Aquabacterium sp.]|uniref:hypothetical protein n=1 Tax=Aquabacterium sp. TaxID=1872578 RepID=UPI0037839D3F
MSHEEDFLRENANKHFVALAYRVTPPGGSPAEEFASCFVVEIESDWYLLTAGHVIERLRRLNVAGAVLSAGRLVDAFAGTSFPPLPADLNLDDWATIDDDETGADFAVVPIDAFTRRGLAAAGVIPLGDQYVGAADFARYRQTVLVGVPAESYSVRGSVGAMRLVMIPLTQQAPTPDMPDKPGTTLGRMAPSPQDPQHRVESVGGMSGSPVFGIVYENGAPAAYCLVGIQSSWHAPSRIVRFCPMTWFIESMHEALAKVRKAIEAADPPASPPDRSDS